MRVAVVFGGRSVEHEVSVVSARTVARGLREAGHEVVPVGIAQDGGWVDPAAAQRCLEDGERALVGGRGAPGPSALLAARPEVAFPIVHGTWGEDGTLQGLFEMLDLAYVGAGVLASALAMDKWAAKRVFLAADIPSVDFVAVARGETWSEAGLRRRFALPLFVKPSVGGSSVGVRRVARWEDLAEAVEFALRFDDVALIERGVEAREIECAVLGYPDLEASVLGEIVPGNEFYDYEDKYLSDRAQLLAPAPLPEELALRIRSLAVRAFAAVRGAGMARVDFFLDRNSGEVFVNEINTLPGFTAISMFPRLWDLSGLPLPGLCDRLVRDAWRRHQDRRRLDRGIKEFLASLAAR